MRAFFRFIFHSFIFRRSLIFTVFFILFFWISNISFDKLWFKKIWNDQAALPLMDLSDVYSPPENYDVSTKIKMRFILPDKVFIEANKKFIIQNNFKNYWFYDTFSLKFPIDTDEIANKIYFNFEDKTYPDSIYLILTKSDQKKIFWKQIFYSSIPISDLNVKIDDSDIFRINESNLVSYSLIKNNDTLIKKSIYKFNNYVRAIIGSNCGLKCKLYRKICDTLSLPCRILNLMGGDAYYAGYYDDIGYPLHALCEIYSSKYNKWYVVDPTYGIILKKNGIPLNAIEISNNVYFNTVNDIELDSIFYTKRSLIGRDYYKFYDNIFFETNFQFNAVITKLLHAFYRDLDFTQYHYANTMLFTKDGHYYFGLKSFMYLLILIIYFNCILIFIVWRLFKAKKI